MRGVSELRSSLGKTQLMLDADRFMHPGRITPKVLPISDYDLPNGAINEEQTNTRKGARVAAALPVIGRVGPEWTEADESSESSARRRSGGTGTFRQHVLIFRGLADPQAIWLFSSLWECSLPQCRAGRGLPPPPHSIRSARADPSRSRFVSRDFAPA